MTKNRDLNGSWHGEDELEDKEWEDKLDDHIENNLSDPEGLRNSRSSFYLQKVSIAEGEVSPRLPGYHVPETNGANDLIHLGDSDWGESRLELHRELSSQPSMARLSRRVDCYEAINDWLASASYVYGCQYELTEQLVLEALSRIENVFLVVNAFGWMSKPEKSSHRHKLEAMKYWYPRIGESMGWVKDGDGYVVRKKCGIRVFNNGDPMISMHEKWMFDRGSGSAIYGSFNMTENAKRNIESVLCLSSLADNHIQSFWSDFGWLEKRSVPWSQFLGQSEGQIDDVFMRYGPEELRRFPLIRRQINRENA